MTGYGSYCCVGQCGATITAENHGDSQEVHCECGMTMICDEFTYPEELCLDCERNCR